MALNPTDEQIERLVADSESEPGPVVMLNLLKFRAEAGDGLDGTGRDAYERYGAQAILKVTEYGGEVVWMGRPDSVVIGGDADAWDAVVLVRYPSRSAFIAMTSDPEYQRTHVHREGGLDDMKLIAMTPGPGF